MILSHGNAAVESGFSVNENLLVENLQERSLVSQRVVYDSIRSVGGVSHVLIAKDMLKNVRSSNARYKEALEEQRKLSLKENEQLSRKKRATLELKTLEEKKRKLEETAKIEKASIDLQMSELKKLL